jgi:hypothetical protein
MFDEISSESIGQCIISFFESWLGSRIESFKLVSALSCFGRLFWRVIRQVSCRRTHMFLLHTILQVCNYLNLLMTFLIETHTIQRRQLQLAQVKLSLTLFSWFQKFNDIVLHFLHCFFDSILLVGKQYLRVSFSMSKFLVKGFDPFILRKQFVMYSKQLIIKIIIILTRDHQIPLHLRPIHP